VGEVGGHENKLKQLEKKKSAQLSPGELVDQGHAMFRNLQKPQKVCGNYAGAERGTNKSDGAKGRH